MEYVQAGLHRTYHRMSFKHLHRYVNEFAGRPNIRDLDTLETTIDDLLHDPNY